MLTKAMHEYNILEKGKDLSVADKAIIMLHGRGATAEDIVSLGTVLCDDSFYIAAPRAHNNTWYPYSFMNADSLNEPWLTSAIKTIKRLVDEISIVIPTERIYIAGFSQGACLALETAARYATKYAGIIAFSGGLIGEIIKPTKYSGSFNRTKVFIGISDNDPHIPVIRCRHSADLLEKMDANVKLSIYPDMGHTISNDEIKEVKDYIF